MQTIAVYRNPKGSHHLQISQKSANFCQCLELKVISAELDLAWFVSIYHVSLNSVCPHSSFLHFEVFLDTSFRP